jgi:hypothetical protein
VASLLLRGVLAPPGRGERHAGVEPVTQEPPGRSPDPRVGGRIHLVAQKEGQVGRPCAGSAPYGRLGDLVDPDDRDDHRGSESNRCAESP